MKRVPKSRHKIYAIKTLIVAHDYKHLVVELVGNRALKCSPVSESLTCENYSIELKRNTYSMDIKIIFSITI